MPDNELYADNLGCLEALAEFPAVLAQLRIVEQEFIKLRALCSEATGLAAILLLGNEKNEFHLESMTGYDTSQLRLLESCAINIIQDMVHND